MKEKDENLINIGLFIKTALETGNFDFIKIVKNSIKIQERQV